MKTKIDVVQGAIAGAVGGVPFGMMMGMMGMLPMVAMLVGSESVAVGFIVHMIISVLTGVAFALVFGSKVTSAGKGFTCGLVYGVIWWFLGPLIFMPLMLDMGVMLSLEGMTNALPSLMGHLVFGGVLGAYYGMVISKRG